MVMKEMDIGLFVPYVYSMDRIICFTSSVYLLSAINIHLFIISLFNMEKFHLFYYNFIIITLSCPLFPLLCPHRGMAAEALSYLSGINWPPPSPPCHQPLSTPFIFYVDCRVVERSAAYNHQQTDSFIAQILCKVGFYHNAPCPYNIVLYFLLNYVSTIKRGRALPGLGIC
jgi:uncharacterized membrane-anchored protein YitT (DUF2179 family)